MKKELTSITLITIIAMFVFTLFLSSVLATEIVLKKNAYFSGETLQAEILGNFLDNIQPEDIALYTNNSVHSLPIESNIIKADGKYLYYAVLPMTAGDYILRIKNVRHTEGNTETSDSIEKTFKITETNESYLSFSPGFIYTSNDFNIIIKGYNKEQQVNVEFSPTKFKQSFPLSYSSSKTVYILIDDIESFTKSDIKINNYLIPAYVFPKKEPPVIINDSASLKNIIVTDTPAINAIILANVDYYFQILVVNKKREALDLNFSSSSDSVSISPKILYNFDSEETLNVTILAKAPFNSSIKISSSRGELQIPINIALTSDKSEVNFFTSPLNTPETCAEWGGEKCDLEKGQKCDGLSKFTSDGNCCIGSCKGAGSSMAWIWGLVIIVIIAVVIYFIYKKSGKNDMQGKFQQIFKKRTEDYKKRINPEPPKELRGELIKN